MSIRKDGQSTKLVQNIDETEAVYGNLASRSQNVQLDAEPYPACQYS